MKAMPKEKKIHSKTVYDTDFLTVEEDDVLLPSGKTGKRVKVKHIGAAASLPITKEGDVLLIRQHRYVIGQDTLEIPAGKKDEIDEDSLVCAKRELEEETKYRAKDFEFLQSVYTAIGFSDERIDIYIAKDVYPLKNPPKADDDEYVEVVKMPLQDAIKKAENGEIKDAKTVLALFGVKVKFCATN